MSVRHLAQISGAWLFTPSPYRDERGFFARTMDREWLIEAGLNPDGFAQDSLSRSSAGVVRGMHLRRGSGESKLVRCSFGAVFDVVVDLRADSPTYKQVLTVRLTDESAETLYIPAGCAHGFQALTQPADVSYRIDKPHDPASGVTIAWDDPELAIAWPLPVTGMSDKDAAAPRLADVLETL